MAVDIEDGLVVPVLRGAGRLDLGQVAHAAADLAARARARKLAPADFEGATFTVTNLAALGVDWFTPVLNPPQCAILGVGRMRRAPAVAGNEIAVRDLATFVVTFDHRALDGRPRRALPLQAEAPAGIARPPCCSREQAANPHPASPASGGGGRIEAAGLPSPLPLAGGAGGGVPRRDGPCRAAPPLVPSSPPS